MIVEENKMKNINYHNVKIFLKSNKKTTETGKLIPLSHTYT